MLRGVSPFHTNIQKTYHFIELELRDTMESKLVVVLSSLICSKVRQLSTVIAFASILERTLVKDAKRIISGLLHTQFVQ